MYSEYKKPKLSAGLNPAEVDARFLNRRNEMQLMVGAERVVQGYRFHRVANCQGGAVSQSGTRAQA